MPTLEDIEVQLETLDGDIQVLTLNDEPIQVETLDDDEITVVVVENEEVGVAVLGDDGLQVLHLRTGPQGVRGPVGPAGSGTSATYVAGQNLSGHSVVTLNSSGEAIYADSETLLHCGRIVGLTTGAASSGDDVEVLILGDVEEPSWSWNTSLPVWASSDGSLTQTTPLFAHGDKFAQIVGFPTSATTLHITLENPIILH